MFRDRIKKVVKRAAIRLLDMEFDTEVRDPRNRTTGTVGEVDQSKIPKVVDGSGDTPGPNHKENIGRPWISAQLAGGVAPIFIDIRPPTELLAGLLPGALRFPENSIRKSLDKLPTERSERVVIYDAAGEQGSAELAAWLREQGWPGARRLQGGFAEWLEHGEKIDPLRELSGTRFAVGDAITLADGRTGQVLDYGRETDRIRYQIWLGSDTALLWVDEDELKV